jgi:serine phosphatase RsbU (regulator of sigma subunit)
MEILGGNTADQRLINSVGVDIWIDSRPYQSGSGGDIHYLSMCGSGRVTRIALADVAGHGSEMNESALWLRRQMRRHINLLDQTRFARALNRELLRQDSGKFATALLATYFAPTQHLIVCNAGHPPPLWFSTAARRWLVLDEKTDPQTLRDTRTRYRLRRVSNLPLGVIDRTAYNQFAVKLSVGDVVLLYTDAFPESRRGGQELGQENLLDFVAQVQPSSSRAVGEAVIEKLNAWRGDTPPGDDQTLIVLRHNGSAPPRMGLRLAVRSLSRMLGLKRV